MDMQVCIFNDMLYAYHAYKYVCRVHVRMRLRACVCMRVRVCKYVRARACLHIF
jgi:hypothetical protein